MTTSTLPLSYDALHAAVAGRAAALRLRAELQPAGGRSDKLFPPTYEGGKYAREKRVLEDGEIVDCILLDSVQSQANRMELALLEAHRSGQITIPVLTVRFDDARLRKRFTVSSLEASHRIADALLRDSLCEGVVFRQSRHGKVLDDADLRNATGLFGVNPTALLYGIWDSTGPRGGLGVKIQRSLVSEIVAINAHLGVRTSSRIDTAQIMKEAGMLYQRRDAGPEVPTWTLDTDLAVRDKNQPRKLGKEGKPSEANHGNVTPTLAEGGITMSHALQTTVLSLPALRRLRFPLSGGADSSPAVDTAARTALAALGLLGATLAAEAGADLRSRCLLVPTAPLQWELLGAPGEPSRRFALDGKAALATFQAALEAARGAGLPWEGDITLQPTEDLLQLVARSQELAAAQPAGEGGA